MMTIVSILLALVIFLLGVLRPSRSSWKYGSILAVILCAVNIYNYFEHEKLQNFIVNSLADIATRIYWDESILTLQLFNKIDKVEAKSVQVQFKIFSQDQHPLPADQPSKGECKIDEKWGYGYLSEQMAYTIYTKYKEKDGSIYLDKERINGVDHLFFHGKEKIKTFVNDGEVSFNLEMGPNTNSNFSSLSKLNNSYLIALINTGYSEGPLPTWVKFKLKTNAGTHLLHFPVGIIRTLEDGSKEVVTSNIRVAGICIPDNFFFNPKGVI